MKNLRFKGWTLDDEIIRDGLCSLAQVPHNEIHKDALVVSGIAVQSYLPSSYRRPTADIDVITPYSLNFSSFKEFAQEAAEHLRTLGYQTFFKKGWASYQLIYFKTADSSDEETALIEVARKSEQNIKRMSEILNREFKNSRRKFVEERDISYKVASPEDIIAPKLVRSIGALQRHPEFISHLRSPTKPVAYTEAFIDEDIAKIKDMRDEASLSLGNPELSELLRFVSDIFDIRILGEKTGFNRDYLEEVLKSWNILREQTKERDVLLNYLIPHISS